MSHMKSLNDAISKAIAHESFAAKKKVLEEFYTKVKEEVNNDTIDLDAFDSCYTSFVNGLVVETKPKPKREKNKYNQFISQRIQELRVENPTLAPQEAMSQASKEYKEKFPKASNAASTDTSVASGDEEMDPSPAKKTVRKASKPKTAAPKPAKAGTSKASAAPPPPKKKPAKVSSPEMSEDELVVSDSDFAV
jgi:hypothetical protein